MKRTCLFFAAVLAVIVLGLAGTATADGDQAGDAKAPAAAATNKTCPISDEAVGDEPVMVEHRGRSVALCCKMCRGKWNKLTDAERDAKLASLGTGKEKADPSKSTATGDPYPLATCPVSGKALGGMGAPVIKNYDGREVRFCCKGCIGRFEKSQDKYLAKIDYAIVEDQEELYPIATCLVSGGKLGSMGDPVDVVIGNRLYRLCCEGCRKKLAANLGTYKGKLDKAVITQQSERYPLKTCVVSGKKLGSMGAVPEIVVANRLVRFCCKGCVAGFQKSPATYLAKLDAAADAAPKKAKSKADKHEDTHKHDHD